MRVSLVVHPEEICLLSLFIIFVAFRPRGQGCSRPTPNETQPLHFRTACPLLQEPEVRVRTAAAANVAKVIKALLGGASADYDGEYPFSKPPLPAI